MGDGFGMTQVHYFYCAFYFYYYYISSTSDHQALDPRGWGTPVIYDTIMVYICHYTFVQNGRIYIIKTKPQYFR